MDAGVPIKAPVAGVAMGLMKDEDEGNIAVLTDIQGLEDFLGDMDFKVSGNQRRHNRYPDGYEDKGYRQGSA